MILLIILAVWFLSLGLFVALKARQPKFQYPTPPKKQSDHTLAA